jgi:hypothetical protein
MDINNVEESDGKTYDGFLPAAGPHDITATTSIVQCDEGFATDTTCTGANKPTLANNRHYYFQTSDGKELKDDDNFDDIVDKDWKPCEMRTRKECADSKSYGITAANVANGMNIQECVMSSPLATQTNANGAFKADVALANINPYIVASVTYLVDKTGLDHDKVMCRLYGDKNDGDKLWGNGNDCSGGIVQDGENGPYSRIAGNYNGNNNGDLTDPNQKDEAEDIDPKDVGTGDKAGGKDFMTFARHDQYIRNDHDGAALYRLTEEDVEFLAAYVAATYAYLLDTATRYTEVGDDGELATEALASRESVLANIRGDCFSPGLSGGGLLYQGGFGAAYFAFGIILIVCHLLWLMYAVTDDESKRFMATRAMSLFGILTALAGLYILFFIYGSGQYVLEQNPFIVKIPPPAHQF